MRVTNQMVTSSSLRNMQKSMQRVSKLNQQVTTHKKISAPSEDPVIAIRALKLRTTVDQLDQYKSKNIKDALSWLGTRMYISVYKMFIIIVNRVLQIHSRQRIVTLLLMNYTH